MSVVLEAREPRAQYLDAMQPATVLHFEMLVGAPGGVARLRELILTLAVRGRLTLREPTDDSVATLLRQIAVAKSAGARSDKASSAEASEEVGGTFKIPDSWAWVAFGAVTQVSGGVTLGRKTAVTQPLAFPYLRVANVQRWRVLFDDLKTVTISAAELPRYQLRYGDLLITEGGDWDKVGRTAVWRDEVSVCLHQNHVFRARGVTSSWNSTWAELYLNSPDARAYFASCSKQTTNLASINMAQLKACAFPLPPLAEQARIVARVGELMRLCDALEAKGRLEAEQHARLLSTLLGTLIDSTTPKELAANWQRMAAHFDLLLDRAEAVDTVEQTILQLAVRGLLTPNSETNAIDGGDLLPSVRRGWTRSHFGDVASMLNGYAFKSEWFKGSGVRLVRNVNVGHGHLDWRQAAYVSPTVADEFAQFALGDGDVVLTLDRPIISTGLKLAIIDRDDLPCLLLQRVARLSPRTTVLTRDFMILWLSSDLFIGAIDPGRSNGVPHISTKQVAALQIDLPPLAEQARIVARVTELRHLCAELRQRLANSQATQSRLADALVESALTA